jgi:predicted N-acetyltransferase YhbS
MDETARVTILQPLETHGDAAIDDVLDQAFGADRHGRTAYKIRDGASWLPHFSYAVADASGSLIALLQSWPVALLGEDGTVTPLIMVGPVAVLPSVQGEGLGRMLMDRLVVDADTHADAPLMMIGDPEYYGRFWDFNAEVTSGWRAPGPVETRRLLLRQVAPIAPLPALSGMLGPRMKTSA